MRTACYLRGLWTGIVLSCTMLVIPMGFGADITINTTEGTITGDDGDAARFRGVPFQTSLIDEVLWFYIPGDVTFYADDVLTVTGEHPACIVAGGNAFIEEGSVLRSSASGCIPGAGGGAAAEGGANGDGGGLTAGSSGGWGGAGGSGWR